MQSEKPTDLFEVFLNLIITVAILVSLWLFAMLVMLFIGDSKHIDEKDRISKPTQLESLSQQSLEQEGMDNVITSAMNRDSETTPALHTFQDIQQKITQQHTQNPEQQVTQKYDESYDKKDSTNISKNNQNDSLKEKLTPHKKIETMSHTSENSSDIKDKKQEKTVTEETQLASQVWSMSALLSNLPLVVFDCDTPKEEVSGVAKLVVDRASSYVEKTTVYKNGFYDKKNDKSNVTNSDSVELEIQFHYAYDKSPTHIQALMPAREAAYALPINAYVLLLQDSIYYYRFVQLDEVKSNIAGMMSIYTKKSHHLINHYNCLSSSVLNLPQVIEHHPLMELDDVQSQKILNF